MRIQALFLTTFIAFSTYAADEELVTNLPDNDWQKWEFTIAPGEYLFYRSYVFDLSYQIAENWTFGPMFQLTEAIGSGYGLGIQGGYFTRSVLDSSFYLGYRLFYDVYRSRYLVGENVETKQFVAGGTAGYRWKFSQFILGIGGGVDLYGGRRDIYWWPRLDFKFGIEI